MRETDKLLCHTTREFVGMYVGCMVDLYHYNYQYRVNSTIQYLISIKVNEAIILENLDCSHIHRYRLTDTSVLTRDDTGPLSRSSDAFKFSV